MNATSGHVKMFNLPPFCCLSICKVVHISVPLNMIASIWSRDNPTDRTEKPDSQYAPLAAVLIIAFLMVAGYYSLVS
jgi:hypothetical protein